MPLELPFKVQSHRFLLLLLLVIGSMYPIIVTPSIDCSLCTPQVLLVCWGWLAEGELWGGDFVWRAALRLVWRSSCWNSQPTVNMSFKDAWDIDMLYCGLLMYNISKNQCIYLFSLLFYPSESIQLWKLWKRSYFLLCQIVHNMMLNNNGFICLSIFWYFIYHWTYKYLINCDMSINLSIWSFMWYYTVMNSTFGSFPFAI